MYYPGTERLGTYCLYPKVVSAIQCMENMDHMWVCTQVYALMTSYIFSCERSRVVVVLLFCTFLAICLLEKYLW